MISQKSHNFKIELAQEHEVPAITKLLNAAYKELADMGLNYTATYQNQDQTKERISKGRCFVGHTRKASCQLVPATRISHCRSRTLQWKNI